MPVGFLTVGIWGGASGCRGVGRRAHGFPLTFGFSTDKSGSRRLREGSWHEQRRSSLLWKHRIIYKVTRLSKYLIFQTPLVA